MHPRMQKVRTPLFLAVALIAGVALGGCKGGSSDEIVIGAFLPISAAAGQVWVHEASPKDSGMTDEEAPGEAGGAAGEHQPA